MMYPLSLIFFTYIIGEISGATLPGTQKEGSLKEQSFSTISDAENLYYDSGKGQFKKISLFYIDFDKLVCDDKFLPISWFVKNSNNEEVLRNGFMNPHGTLETSNSKTNSCALTKKFYLNKDEFVLVADKDPRVVTKKEIHAEISKLLWEKSFINWVFHLINCYNERNNKESIQCAAKNFNFYLTILVVIILIVVKLLRVLINVYRKILIVLSVVNTLHNSQSQQIIEPSQIILSGNNAKNDTAVTTGRRKRVPNSKYS